ncbi:MAG: EamA family transporter [Melioribacteraceae bacterium]|nr:EamA family transporter [Melioribacteraceae bacterium]
MISVKNNNTIVLTYATLLLLALIWGSSFILIKRGLDAFSPLQVGTLRIAFAFILLFPLAIRRIKKHADINWKLLLLFGMVANLLPAVLFSAAETGLSSSLAGVLNSLTPIFTLIIGIIFFSTPVNYRQSFGLGLGFVGSVMISLVGSSGGIGEFNFYVLFVITATICYGFAGNMVKRYFMNINSVTLTSFTFLTVGPIALIYVFSSDFTDVMANNDKAWSSLIYIFILSSIGTAFALILFNRIIQNTSAVFASTVTYLIPIAAIGWGIIDGEILYPFHFAGIALIIAGVYIVNKFK